MEDYVTFNQAVKLKELGFDGFDDNWDCDYWYYYSYENSNEPIFERREITDYYDVEKSWYAPTLAQAQKWLREKGIILLVYASSNLETGASYFYHIFKEKSLIDIEAVKAYKIYEEALSEGINDAIELLIQQSK